MNLVDALRESERTLMQTAREQQTTIANQQTMIEAVQRERARDLSRVEQQRDAEINRSIQLLDELRRAREQFCEAQQQLAAARVQIAQLKVAIFDIQNPTLA